MYEDAELETLLEEDSDQTPEKRIRSGFIALKIVGNISKLDSIGTEHEKR